MDTRVQTYQSPGVSLFKPSLKALNPQIGSLWQGFLMSLLLPRGEYIVSPLLLP